MTAFCQTRTEGNQHTKVQRYFWALFVLLTLLSLYDLLLPQFTAPTILRQAQTAMLTDNFVKEGFTFKGLYLNIYGNDKPVLALEFPIYNFIVGLLFKIFGSGIFPGKLVSFLASVMSLVVIRRLLAVFYDEKFALWCGLFFVLSPLGMMMRTAFQPDALALMFVLLSLAVLHRWYATRAPEKIVLFSLLLLFGGLAKYPVMVPYLPLITLAVCTNNGRFQRPGIKEIAIISALFVLPFLSWYVSCGHITNACFGNAASDRSTFLIGDLRRFLSLLYYVNPVYSIVTLACSGIGVLFLLTGLRRLSAIEKALAAGIPLYFIIIPTVSYQHYYLFACTPIFAFFMARGWLMLGEMYKNRHAVFVRNSLLVLFIAGFACMSLYAIVLRNDRVMVDAAHTVNKLSKPDDLVFAVTMHNRTAIFGGINSTFFYLAKRKGWNADLGVFKELDQSILTKIEEQAETRRRQGARWMIISWYSPELESPVEAYVPKSAHTRVDPGFDGSVVFNALESRYITAYKAKNYAVFKLQAE